MKRMPYGWLGQLRVGLGNIRIKSLMKGRGPFALADQVMISAMNFLTGIVLVRALGLAEFGIYAVAYAILLYVNSAQLSIVIAPMFTIAPLQDSKMRKVYLEGMFAIQVLSSAALCVTFVILGVCGSFIIKSYGYITAISFACCVGTYQLQDWMRRYYFLERRGASALITDSISYVGQIVLLLVFWKSGKLTLSMAFLIMAITSFAGFLMGPVYDGLRLKRDHISYAWQESKPMGRDMLIANQARWFGIQGVLLIATYIVGPRSIGGLRATQNLTGPLNLALLSIDNVIPAKLSEKMVETGVKAAYQSTVKAIVLIIACAGLLLPVIVYGKTLLRLFYGAEVVPFYGAMLLQIFNVMLNAIATIQFYFYRAVRETKVMMAANISAAVVSIGSIIPLARAFGAIGVVVASTVGQVSIITISIVYWRIHRHRIMEEGLPRVLQTLS